jgi:maleylacetate reductase
MPHYFRAAVMMPSVLHYNRPAAEAAQTSIAAALGAGGQDAREALCRFCRQARSAASAHRCRRQRRSLIGKNGMLSIFTRANPQPIRAPADVVKILKLAA